MVRWRLNCCSSGILGCLTRVTTWKREREINANFRAYFNYPTAQTAPGTFKSAIMQHATNSQRHFSANDLQILSRESGWHERAFTSAASHLLSTGMKAGTSFPTATTRSSASSSGSLRLLLLTNHLNPASARLGDCPVAHVPVTLPQTKRKPSQILLWPLTKRILLLKPLSPTA